MEAMSAGRWLLIAMGSFMPALFVMIATWFRLGDREVFATQVKTADGLSLALTLAIVATWLAVLCSAALPRFRLIALCLLGAVLFVAWLAPSVLQSR